MYCKTAVHVVHVCMGREVELSHLAATHIPSPAGLTCLILVIVFSSVFYSSQGEGGMG